MAWSSDYVATPKGEFEIKDLSSNSIDGGCIFRNQKKLFCVPEGFPTSFKSVVLLKDFNIVPIDINCGGNRCYNSSTTLIIESNSRFLINKQLGNFSIEEVKEVDVDKNRVIFVLNEGPELPSHIAVFDNGKIAISKLKK
jgi:hypothetical protein